MERLWLPIYFHNILLHFVQSTIYLSDHYKPEHLIDCLISCVYVYCMYAYHTSVSVSETWIGVSEYILTLQMDTCHTHSTYTHT